MVAQLSGALYVLALGVGSELPPAYVAGSETEKEMRILENVFWSECCKKLDHYIPPFSQPMDGRNLPFLLFWQPRELF